MPIYLVTAKNGHGKGQFMIDQILKLQKENDKRQKQGLHRRPIFTNIHGINEQGKKPLPDCQPLPENPYIFFGKQDDPENPPPEHCFLPPIGSIFIFDECQEFDWVKNKSGALSSDIRVTSLEKHRHAGHDIWFVTQSPNYVHSHIQGLVSPQFYLERPLGMAFTNVFRYNTFQRNPDAQSVMKKADDHFTLKIGKKLGAYYQSSAEHNIKFNIPKKLIFAIGFFLIIVCLFLYRANQTKQIYEKKHAKNNDVVDTQTIQQQEQQLQQLQNPQQQEQPPTPADELQKLKDEQAINQYNRRIYLMQNNLPKDYEVIKSEPVLQVRGVIKMGNKCQAYNTHGDLMTLSQKECENYLKETGRVHKSTSQPQLSTTPTS